MTAEDIFNIPSPAMQISNLITIPLLALYTLSGSNQKKKIDYSFCQLDIKSSTSMNPHCTKSSFSYKKVLIF